VLRPANVKRSKTERLAEASLTAREVAAADCSIADVVLALRRDGLPYKFVRWGKSINSWKTLIAAKKGIFVARLNFLDAQGELDKHFVMVDCWRGLIVDGAEPHPIPFAAQR
jgi:hypothetical protein